MIFINYRREDSAATAGRLHDRLAQVFGRKRIFMDVDQIPAGIDFVAHLNSQVAACNVLLVLIGPHWLNVKNEAGERRLHQPDDFVAIEIAAALARDIRVIPVLVDGAVIPKVSELPDSLKLLVRRQAIEVRQAHFGRDADALIERLREALGDKAGLGRWRLRALVGAAAIAALLLIGVGGYVFVGHIVEQGVQRAELNLEEGRKAAEAEANRKVMEAANQAEQERQAKRTQEAEAKRQADEAEKARQAAESKAAQATAAQAAAADGRQTAGANDSGIRQPNASEKPRGWVGVRIQQVTDAIAETLNITPPRGALVAGVDDKGPAKLAGIEPADVVVSFDGHDIKELGDLPRAVADTPVGKVVDVVVIRKGKQETHKVTVGRLQDNEKVAEASAKQEAPPDISVVQKTLGLELSQLSDDQRRKFKIKSAVNGVLVTGVDASVATADPDKRLALGDVIVEVQYQAVASPADMQKRIDQLKGQGKKIAVLLVSNGNGDTHFVALNLGAPVTPQAAPPVPPAPRP